MAQLPRENTWEEAIVAEEQEARPKNIHSLGNQGKGTKTGRKKEGLRDAQVRILKALAKTLGWLNKRRICQECADEFPTAARFDAWISDPLGLKTPELRPAAEKKAGYPSLITLGYVLARELDIDGKSEMVYRITQAGQDALARCIEERVE